MFEVSEEPNENTDHLGGDQGGFLIKLADITQETYSWGTIAEVYLSSEGPQQQKHKTARFGNISLLLRHIVPHESNKRTKEQVRLEIQSTTLREAFANIAIGRVNINLYENPIVIPEPYTEIYHCRKRIQEAFERCPDGPLKDELQLLQDFQDEYLSRDLENLHAFEKYGLIVSNYIQFLFVPGSLVLLPNRSVAPHGAFWAAIVIHCQITEEKDIKYWDVTFAYTSSNDGNFGTVFETIRCPFFSTVRRIIDLPIFPLKYHPDRHAIYKSLLRRGVKYKEVFQDSIPNTRRQGPVAFGSHHKYDGQFFEAANNEGKTNDVEGAIHSEKASSPVTTFRKFPSSNYMGRIVLDPVGFLEEESKFREDVRHDISGPSSILLGKEAGDNFDKLPKQVPTKPDDASGLAKSAGTVTDLQLVTMPPIISGFSLTRRSWGYFLIDNISEIEWNDEAYDNLQMDSRKKELIRRTLEEHRYAPMAFDDMIQGKGAGLVLLLHGPPGSGKTMTAETVAESLRSPLYYTTGGEFGRTTNEIEGQFRLIFRRIQRWAAILLFDEADVFMAKRSEDSIERNALVSILLRSLEYQSGILFLTTNRVTDFDTAFYSRIHIRIEFDSPNKTQRAFIWQKLASQLHHDISEDEFQSLGSLEVDGRRIKNVLKVASLLMRSRGKDSRLRLDDVKNALHISAGDPNERNAEEKVRGFSG